MMYYRILFLFDFHDYKSEFTNFAEEYELLVFSLLSIIELKVVDGNTWLAACSISRNYRKDYFLSSLTEKISDGIECRCATIYNVTRLSSHEARSTIVAQTTLRRLSSVFISFRAIISFVYFIFIFFIRHVMIFREIVFSRGERRIYGEGRK